MKNKTWWHTCKNTEFAFLQKTYASIHVTLLAESILAIERVQVFADTAEQGRETHITYALLSVHSVRRDFSVPHNWSSHVVTGRCGAKQDFGLPTPNVVGVKRSQLALYRY